VETRGARGVQVGMRQGHSPLPDLGWSPPEMWVEVPHSVVPGFGPWAGARGSLQVSAPDVPLYLPHLSAETHSPSFGGEGERQGPWIQMVESGPSSGPGAAAL
jgi:hypothetical protein